MNRIAILGTPGAGKTYFARKMAQKLGLPLHHFDPLFFDAHWVERDKEAFEKAYHAILSQEKWILEGNGMSYAASRFARADMVVFMTFSRWGCLCRIFTRMIKGWFLKRPDLPAGCPEIISWKLLSYTWRYQKKYTSAIKALSAEYPQVRFVHISRRAQMVALINSI